MKSKVKFDLSENNQPIIIAEIEHSDDVRDKIALRFKEALGYDSFFGYIKFEQQIPCTGDGVNNAPKNILCIEPISSNLNELEELRDALDKIIKIAKENRKAFAE
jgi:hypothetical protein